MFSLKFIVSQIDKRTPIGPCRKAFFQISRYGNLTWRTWMSSESIITSDSFWNVRLGARLSCLGYAKVWMRLGGSLCLAVQRRRLTATSQRKFMWHQRKVFRHWGIHMRRHLGQLINHWVTGRWNYTYRSAKQLINMPFPQRSIHINYVMSWTKNRSNNTLHPFFSPQIIRITGIQLAQACLCIATLSDFRMT